MARTCVLLFFIFSATTIRNCCSLDAFSNLNAIAASNVTGNKLISPKVSTTDEVPSIFGSANDTTYIIHIWVMLPFDNYYIFSKNHVESAVFQAIEDANATLCDTVRKRIRDKFQNTCYKIRFNDTRCDADYSMTQAVAIQSSTISEGQCSPDGEDESINDLDVIVGMSCDYCAGRIATLATSWQWPAIFAGTRTSSLDDKTKSCCQTLTRVGHTATDLGNFVYKLFHEYEVWSKSYLVYSAISTHGAPTYDYKQLPSDCSMLTAGITTVFTDLNFSGYTPYQISNDDFLIKNVEEILERIRTTSRVSMWCVGRKAMRKVMNTAHMMGMTSGAEDQQFVFFYIDLYNTNTSFIWSNVDDQPCSTGDYCDADVGESTDGMRALQVITLHQTETAEYKQFSDAMKNDANMIQPGLAGTGQFVNPYVSEYYNAIRLLVNGVERRVEENNTDWSDGAGFAASLWNTSFLSVDGEVFINETGDQVMNYALMDMNETTNRFEIAALYYGFNTSWINVTDIDWPGSKIPPNKPLCGDYESCPGGSTLTIGVKALISIAGVLALLLFVTFFVGKRKVNHEKRLRKMKWKVKPEDVVYGTRERRMSTSTGSSVSEMLISGAATGRQMFATTAHWKNYFVAVKRVNYLKKVHVDREMQLEMEMLVSLDNEHLCKFFGASVEEPVLILTEYCPRGSLQDFLDGDMYGKLDDVFRNSLILDIAQGMQFLHKISIHSHGNLKSSNCLLSSRLVVKLSDFGLAAFRPRLRRDSVIGYNHYKDLLWTAPELLRMETPPVKGTQKGDVYSFGIVVQEILYTMGTFYLGEDARLGPDEICKRVQESSATPFRPTLDDNDDVVIGDRMRSFVEECWAENAESRPTFSQISVAMKKHTKKLNLFDQMLRRLEQYSTTLEDKVEERTLQYKSEKERADKLLYQMLPKGVTDRLKRGQNVEPSNFDCVTIYFSDIVGFTAISHDSTPFQVVDMLDSLYTIFDQVVDRLDVYKVETIGDAYMVVSGLPELNGKLHVREISRMALNLIEEVKRFKIPHMPNKKLELRVGIHSGPVVAGVVGKKMPRYCLFGDTVNTAARMEQNGLKMRIHVSPATKSLLNEFESFIVETREDKVTMKGLGTWQTWWLVGEIIDDKEGERVDLAVSAKIADDASPLVGKKISSSSDYSSARSSLQQSMQRIQKSVTGVDLEEVIEMEMAMTPSILVTNETEYERQERSLRPQEWTEAESKRRRTGVNDIPKELVMERSILQFEQNERSVSGLPIPKSADSITVKKVQRKVKFGDPSASAIYPSSALKKPKNRDSGLAFDNNAFASENDVTRV